MQACAVSAQVRWLLNLLSSCEPLRSRLDAKPQRDQTSLQSHLGKVYFWCVSGFYIGGFGDFVCFDTAEKGGVARAKGDFGVSFVHSGRIRQGRI